MARITNLNASKYCYLDDDSFEQQKMMDIVKLKDNIIKNLVAKQFLINTSLRDAVGSKIFVSADKKETCNLNNSGLLSCEDFSKNIKEEDKIQFLLSCGLDQSDIMMLTKSTNGDNSNPGSHDKLYKIDKKLKFHETLREEHSSNVLESKSGDKVYSIDSKFTGLEHPMNYIKELEKKMFPASCSSNNSREEIPGLADCKRKRRKGNKTKAFRKDKMIDKFSNRDAKHRTFWDMEEIPILSVNPTRNQNYDSVSINSNVHEYLNHSENNPAKKFLKFDYSKPFVYKLDQNDLIKKSVIFHNRLSLTEIVLLDKFESYSPGSPTNTLFIKNLSRNVSPLSIIELFGNFEQESETNIEYRILSGKMKGQAFIRFNSVDVASEAMDICNGYLIDGRPIVIEYAKGRKEEPKT